MSEACKCSRIITTVTVPSVKYDQEKHYWLVELNIFSTFMVSGFLDGSERKLYETMEHFPKM